MMWSTAKTRAMTTGRTAATVRAWAWRWYRRRRSWSAARRWHRVPQAVRLSKLAHSTQATSSDKICLVIRLLVIEHIIALSIRWLSTRAMHSPSVK